MSVLLTILFIILLAALLGLNIFSLPGNWIALGLIALWKLFHPELDLGWGFWAFLCVLAAIGEVIEFCAQIYGTKKYGGSSGGNLGGIIGAIAGAIIGACFLLGLGAIPGALLGAFGGCYLIEIIRGQPTQEATRAAWGAMWGKMIGMTVKFGLGVSIVVMAASKIWPGGEVAV